MKQLWAVVLLALLAPLLLGACEDEGDQPLQEAEGQVEEFSQQAREQAGEQADNIGEELGAAGDDLSGIGEEVKQSWNENCQQMTEAEEDESRQNELRDICGDLRQGIEDNSREAVEAARDRLDELRGSG